jgi:stress response protein SCP2
MVMSFGEIYRIGIYRKFKAVGQDFAGGLEPFSASFGVNV